MSVYNPQPQSFLEQLDFMSTDIRQQKKDIAAAKAIAIAAQGDASNAISIGQAAQQAADTVSNAVQVVTGTVETLSVEMVRKFKSGPIAAIAFELDAVAGYYYAVVSHMLGDAAPDIEVYDNDGDKQRIQSIIVDNNTIRLELDSEDMASNSFPLTCICLGKNSPVAPVAGGWEAVPGDIGELRLLNGNVERSLDGGLTVERQVFPGLIAVEAFIGANSRVYARLDNGGFVETLIGTWTVQGSTVSDFNAAKSDPSAVILY